ncbi:hypothetical protein [Clostridium septicum]|uniref:hypothetical protein n=1 Tax=Clostridium septicum TaxID=1504 RepID=UPI00159EDE4A|nr:hypothetical protein [Clostridium septicum]
MVIKVMLIIIMHLLIFYSIKMDLKEYLKKMNNEINNKSIRKKLIEPEELSNTFQNLEG